MHRIAQLASLAATATLAGMIFPSLASADVTGEMSVAATVSGNTVTVTVTDTVVGDLENEDRLCSVDISDPTGISQYSEGRLITTWGSVHSTVITDVPDGVWQVDYLCAVYDEFSTLPNPAPIDLVKGYWATSADYSSDWTVVPNRTPITVTVPQTVTPDPGCFGSACYPGFGSS